MRLVFWIRHIKIDQSMSSQDMLPCLGSESSSVLPFPFCTPTLIVQLEMSFVGYKVVTIPLQRFWFLCHDQSYPNMQTALSNVLTDGLFEPLTSDRWEFLSFDLMSEYFTRTILQTISYCPPVMYWKLCNRHLVDRQMLGPHLCMEMGSVILLFPAHTGDCDVFRVLLSLCLWSFPVQLFRCVIQTAVNSG